MRSFSTWGFVSVWDSGLVVSPFKPIIDIGGNAASDQSQAYILLTTLFLHVVIVNCQSVKWKEYDDAIMKLWKSKISMLFCHIKQTCISSE